MLFLSYLEMIVTIIFVLNHRFLYPCKLTRILLTNSRSLFPLTSKLIFLWLHISRVSPPPPSMELTKSQSDSPLLLQRDSHFNHKQTSMADKVLSVSRSFLSKKDKDSVTDSCSVYRRRWYILIVFSLIAGVQAAAWNTWGPIAGSAEDVFGWSDGTIALLENWGPIAYIVSFALFSWLLDVKGVRFYYFSRHKIMLRWLDKTCFCTHPFKCTPTARTRVFVSHGVIL